MYFFITLLSLRVLLTLSYGGEKCPRHPDTRLFDSSIKSKISGGITAAIGDIPYQAEVRGNGKKCSGIIIHKRWILTAAHCFHIPEWAKDVLVYYRLTDREDPYRSYYCRRVLLIIPHKDYDLNDLTLMKVNKDIKMNDIVQVFPALIREYKLSDIVGRKAVASGWGFIKQTVPTQYLNYLEMMVISKNACYRWFGSYVETDAIFCARAKNATGNICGGDSGGPLVLKGTRDLIGVVVFGKKKSCGRNDATGFMNVTYYRTWIRDTIAPDVLP